MRSEGYSTCFVFLSVCLSVTALAAIQPATNGIYGIL